ncbi:MAG: hypothetical protein FWH51_03965 [Dehalococcoidia bacterium]|nr:hypothetical protein [Dehalococcoidia bacterium]
MAKKLLSCLFIACVALMSCTSGMPEDSNTPVSSPSEGSFFLNVTAGTGGSIAAGAAQFISGTYLEGAEIGLPSLRSDPESRFVFDKWVVYSSDFAVLRTIDQMNAVFIMPPYDVTVVATFKELSDLFNLTIIVDEARGYFAEGTASLISGDYYKGTTIKLPTAYPYSGFVFAKWVAYSSDHNVLWNTYIQDAELIMPPRDLILIAEFEGESIWTPPVTSLYY